MSYIITVQQLVKNPRYGTAMGFINKEPRYIIKDIMSSEVIDSPVLKIAKIIDDDEEKHYVA